MYGKEYHEWQEAETIIRYIEMRVGGLVADVRREFLDDCDDAVRQLVEEEVRARYPLPPPPQHFSGGDRLHQALLAQRMQAALPTHIVRGHGGFLGGIFGGLTG